VWPAKLCLFLAFYGKSKQALGQFFILTNILFQHIAVPTNTNVLQPITYRVVDFLNARPHLGYETNFDKRHGLF